MIDTQFMIDTQLPLTITGRFIDNEHELSDSLGILPKRVSFLDLEDCRLVSSNVTELSSFCGDAIFH